MISKPNKNNLKLSLKIKIKLFCLYKVSYPIVVNNIRLTNKLLNSSSKRPNKNYKRPKPNFNHKD